jgi:hypothetical protein
MDGRLQFLSYLLSMVEHEANVQLASVNTQRARKRLRPAVG